MVQLGSILCVTDKTCAVLVQCIKVLGSSKKKIAIIGELMIVSLKWLNARKYKTLKVRLQTRFLKGSLHRGLLIRACVNFLRISGIRIKFDTNTVVLVTKAKVPVSNRIYGPVLRELCMRWPSVGCVSNCII